MRHLLEAANQESSTLKTVNHMMVDSNNNLLRTLEKHREVIDQEEFETNIKAHRSLYDDLIEHKPSSFIGSTV